MLLRSLAEHANSRDDLAPAGYAPTRIAWFIELGPNGELSGFTRTSDSTGGRKDRGKSFMAPHTPRSSDVGAKLLADNGEYVLGVARKDSKEAKVKGRHQAFIEEVRKCAAEVKDPAIAAVLKFLENWKPDKGTVPKDLDPSDTLTFRVGRTIPIELASIKSYRARMGAPGEGRQMTCLVCNREKFCLESLPFQIKGIPGTKQAAMVSANEDAFLSYGLKRSLISPICLECAEAFAKAANALLEDDATHIAIGEVAWIFWTKEPTDFSPASMLRSPEPDQVRALLESPRSGQKGALKIDMMSFYAAALTANKARVAVRDWVTTTVADAKRNLARYFELQRITQADGSTWQPLKLFALAASTARRAEDVRPETVTDLLRTALHGGMLPTRLLCEVLQRNRVEQQVSNPRAALIKMVLLSQQPSWKGGDEMVALDPEERNPAYLCGRLLAVLENIQHAAIPGLETGIVERFYGSASATPATVFPTLVRKAMAHLNKLQGTSPAARAALQERLEQITEHISIFPKTLALKDQGLFSLGYFHQRAHDRAQARERREAKDAVKMAAAQ